MVSNRALNLLSTIEASVRLPGSVVSRLTQVDPLLLQPDALKMWLNVFLSRKELHGVYVSPSKQPLLFDALVALIDASDASSNVTIKSIAEFNILHRLFESPSGQTLLARGINRPWLKSCLRNSDRNILSIILPRISPLDIECAIELANLIPGGDATQYYSVFILPLASTELAKNPDPRVVSFCLWMHVSTRSPLPVPWSKILNGYTGRINGAIGQAALAHATFTVPEDMESWARLVHMSEALDIAGIVTPNCSASLLDSLLSPSMLPYMNRQTMGMRAIRELSRYHFADASIRALKSTADACFAIAWLHSSRVAELSDIVNRALRSNDDEQVEMAIYALKKHASSPGMARALDGICDGEFVRKLLDKYYGTDPSKLVWTLFQLDPSVGSSVMVKLLRWRPQYPRVRSIVVMATLWACRSPTYIHHIPDSIWTFMFQTFCKDWFPRGTVCSINNTQTTSMFGHYDGTYELRALGRHHMFSIQLPRFLQLHPEPCKFFILQSWVCAIREGIVPVGCIETVRYVLRNSTCFRGIECTIYELCGCILKLGRPDLTALIERLCADSYDANLTCVLGGMIPVKSSKMDRVDDRLFKRAMLMNCVSSARALVDRQTSVSEWIVRVMLEGPGIIGTGPVSKFNSSALLRALSSYIASNLDSLHANPHFIRNMVTSIAYATRVDTYSLCTTGKEVKLPSTEGAFLEEVFSSVMSSAPHSFSILVLLTIYFHNDHLVTTTIAQKVVDCLNQGCFEVHAFVIMQKVMSRPLPKMYERLWELSVRQPKRTRGYEEDLVRHLPRELLREVMEMNGMVVPNIA
jgi:hypothetical protein